MELEIDLSEKAAESPELLTFISIYMYIFKLKPEAINLKHWADLMLSINKLEKSVYKKPSKLNPKNINAYLEANSALSYLIFKDNCIDQLPWIDKLIYNMCLCKITKRKLLSYHCINANLEVLRYHINLLNSCTNSNNILKKRCYCRIRYIINQLVLYLYDYKNITSEQFAKLRPNILDTAAQILDLT